MCPNISVLGLSKVNIVVIKKSFILSTLYVLFALDSAFKIDFGFQVHIGLILLLVCCSVSVFLKPTYLYKFFKKDTVYFLLIFYILGAGFVFFQKGYISVSVYLLLSLLLYLACFIYEDKIGAKAFYYFQIIMIVTGLLQYFVFKLTGYQISFIDAEHYQKGSSVSHRLRGFFIEPNWFAISFAFNSLLLIGRDVITFIKENKYLAFFSALVIILNGSLTTIGILVLIYSIPFLLRSPIKAIIGMFFLMLLLFSVFYFRMGINQKQPSEMLNHTSRLIPFERVVEYQSSNGLDKIIFGNGLGSWGTIAVQNRLSVLVYDEEPSARDGSEAAVMLFEFGVLGVLFILMDLTVIYFRANSKDHHLKGGILLFFVCLLFYPTLKFWLYMPYYFLIRVKIIKSKFNDSSLN